MTAIDENVAWCLELGPCDRQEDAVAVHRLDNPDRLMIAVADGCSGGQEADGHSPAEAALSAAKRAWENNERCYGPLPDIAAIFSAAHQAVLDVPIDGSCVRTQDPETDLLKRWTAGSPNEAHLVAQLQAELIHPDAECFPDNRDARVSWGTSSPGMFDPASTLSLAVWDAEGGLRWGVGGDSALCAVRPDGEGVILECAPLRLKEGGCLGIASPRPYYGCLPNAAGWTIVALTDGVYPLLYLLDEDATRIHDPGLWIAEVASLHKKSGGNVSLFVEMMMDSAKHRTLNDNAAIAAARIPDRD